MSSAGPDSSVDELSAGKPSVEASQIWLNGEVLSCACPDCGAPMTIRLWLRLAECRLCGAQVELTEEQEQAAQRLLESREFPQMPGLQRSVPPTAPWSQPVEHRGSPLKPLPILKPPALPPAATLPAPPPVVEPRLAPEPPPPVAVIVPPPLPREAASVVPAIVESPPLVAVPVFDELQPMPTPRRRWISRRLLDAMISCLVSLLTHMLVVILLGLMFYKRPISSTFVLHASFSERTGPAGLEAAVQVDPKPRAVNEAPIVVKQVEVAQREVKLALDQLNPKKISADLVLTPEVPLPAFTNSGKAQSGSMFGGRDPRIRSDIVRREGGDDKSERAVVMGLQWLARHQASDGSWSLDHFAETNDCRGECDGNGTHSDTAATALAVLPFLGAAHTHRSGEYREVVRRGLEWLIKTQRPDGSFTRVDGGNMYAHGQAAIVLCEAYALTRDRWLQEPAQRAVDYIIAAQHPAGGWRYRPGQAGDLSVTGWQVMALRSAKVAYLTVPDEALTRAGKFLDATQTEPSSGRFRYMPGAHENEAMTAEGLLCRQYSGWKPNYPPLVHGAEWLLREAPPDARRGNMYYWYYATQVMHHLGGKSWQAWNDQMRPILVDSQVQDGHAAGSWAPSKRGHDDAGGRLYMTALAVCTLEVYYRHLPLYRAN